MGKMDFWRGAGSWEAPRGREAGDVGEALLLTRSFEESRQGWFWATDDEGRVTYLSSSISEALSPEGDVPLGCHFADLFAPAEEALSSRQKLPFMLARHAPFEKIIVRAADSEDAQFWSLSGYPQFDRGGQFTGFRGSGLDITEQRESSRHASHLAKYDALTGLPNRRSMSETLHAALDSQMAPPCTILLVDLDRFKQVNDTLGHPAGDALLKQVADRLLRIVGDRENVFRLGGDEFQIILPRCDDRGLVGDMATQIIGSVSQPYSINGHRCIIGASIGIGIAPADGSTAEELIRTADLALYASKEGGRGRFRFFSRDLLRAAEEKRLLEEELRDALAKEQLSVEYQPIVETVTNSVKGVEALVRWRHPERGPISPALFIPIAEEMGLIGTLGEWVLRKACQDAASWPTKLRVAINVSPLQFANESFPDTVAAVLQSSGLAPDQLELEITEGVFLSDSAETDTMFTRLKKIGVRLALDDFGTGYSSLSYLRNAPFDKIKIDQTFVRAATLPGSRNGAIIAAIVALANALGMETTAEGIEYMDQLQLIRDLGVSHVQGYVYSKPVGADAVRRSIVTGSWTIRPSGPAQQRSERQAIYRKVGVLHGTSYEPALIRNLSDSGALVEGLGHAVRGDLCIVDFGDGQLTYAKVTRTSGRQKGISFAEPLVDDGNGGLCTRQRISPYLLATMGMPTVDKVDGPSEVSPKLLPLEALGKRLGLDHASQPQRAEGSAIGPLPVSGVVAHPAAQLAPERMKGRPERESIITSAEAERIVDAAMESHNRQLKYIVSLLMLSGARPSELLRARWSDIDLDAAIWNIPLGKAGKTRRLPISRLTAILLRQLPRWDDCEHVIANPATRKPYRSLTRSWEAVRAKAGLPYLELDDLRFCRLETVPHRYRPAPALQEAVPADELIKITAADDPEKESDTPAAAWLLEPAVTEAAAEPSPPEAGPMTG